MPSPTQPQIQFDRAEFDGRPLTAVCASCGRELGASAFEFLGKPICANCAAILRDRLPSDTTSVFWRSVGVGAVVALALAILELLILTHMGASAGWIISLGAIGVGWSIGSAMRSASAGAGGMRYQIAGSLLAYAAIVVPLAYALLPLGNGLWLALLTLVLPVVLLFSHAWHTAFVLLFIAFIGVRWTWGMLRGGPRITERKTA